MLQQENNNKHYSAEDFERYHSGKMTEREMHALEKAALDDPFLSDALDGYMNTSSAIADINELKNKLLPKEADKKTVWFRSPLLKIAAVLILFAGFGWLLYNNSTKKNEIAANKDENIRPASVDKKMADTAVTKQEDGLLAVIPSDEVKQQTTPIQINDLDKPTGKKDKASAEGVIVTASGATNSFTLTQSNVQSSVAPISDSVRNMNAQYYTIQSESANNNNIDNALAGKVSGVQGTTLKKVRGRITDSKGNPVSFANVIDRKNNVGVQSTKEGIFAFTSPDSSPSVDVNATGYKTVTKALSNDSANNLVLLEQDNALNEVIVTSAFEKRNQRPKSSSEGFFKDEKTQRITITNAIPVNGWQNFNKYVSDSLKTLEQLGPTSVSAEILVSFDVNEKGEPVDIDVKRSLCNACNEEAIRIIKNSPPWKLNKKRKKANAVVRF